MNLKSGTIGWALLSAYVLGWDYGVAGRRGGETLSSSFLRAAKHPQGRWPVVVLWAVTTLHLFGGIPRQVDPFHVVARLVRIEPK